MTTMRTIIVIGLVAMLTLAACGGESSRVAPTPATPSPTAALDATPTVEVIGGLEVRPLVTGDEIEIPAGVALLILTGCIGCGAPPTGIERVYRDSSGKLQRDVLFYLPVPNAATDDPDIAGVAVSQDGSIIAITVCTRGYCGGDLPATPDARTSLRVSEDGGETWSEVAQFDDVYYARAVLQGEILLRHLSETEDGARSTFELFPSGFAVTPPEEQARPISLSDTELAWTTPDGRWLRDDGSIIATLGEGYRTGWRPSGGLRRSPSGGELALTFSRGTLSDSTFYLAVVESDGQVSKIFSRDVLTSVAAWLPSGEAVGNASFPVEHLSPPPSISPLAVVTLPAIFDLETGLVRPIAGQFLEAYGRNFVLAVVPAP